MDLKLYSRGSIAMPLGSADKGLKVYVGPESRSRGR